MTDSTSEGPNPSGLCMCGCGRPAPIAKKTNATLGHVKGQPVRFIPGHTQTKRYRMEDPNPTGLCQCGCGQTTPIAKMTRTASGLVKGCHVRFVTGHRPLASFEERVWTGIAKSDDPAACWPWLRSCDSKGYGQINYQGRLLRVHRVVFMLTFGDLGDSEEVLHSCDNPRCCTPRHLSKGSHANNMRDMLNKGRHRSGFAIAREAVKP